MAMARLAARAREGLGARLRASPALTDTAAARHPRWRSLLIPRPPLVAGAQQGPGSSRSASSSSPDSAAAWTPERAWTPDRAVEWTGQHGALRRRCGLCPPRSPSASPAPAPDEPCCSFGTSSLEASPSTSWLSLSSFASSFASIGGGACSSFGAPAASRSTCSLSLSSFAGMPSASPAPGRDELACSVGTSLGGGACSFGAPALRLQLCVHRRRLLPGSPCRKPFHLLAETFQLRFQLRVKWRHVLLRPAAERQQRAATRGRRQAAHSCGKEVAAPSRLPRRQLVLDLLGGLGDLDHELLEVLELARHLVALLLLPLLAVQEGTPRTLLDGLNLGRGERPVSEDVLFSFVHLGSEGRGGFLERLPRVAAAGAAAAAAAGATTEARLVFILHLATGAPPGAPPA
eukprot:scaffold124162_cov57-Phaeocystis_antarctica.AAC.2